MKRPTIHQFIENVDWATARNINILKNGYYKYKDKTIVAELYQMANTKRVPALKRLFNAEGHAIFAPPDTKRKSVGTHQLAHDVRVRDCLAKIAHERGIDVFTQNDKTADGIFENIYIEYDSGKKDRKQLAEQMRYYRGKGNYRVLFIAGSHYGEEFEEGRMIQMMEYAGAVFREKQGRFLVSTYHEFINNFRVWDLKGQLTTLD